MAIYGHSWKVEQRPLLADQGTAACDRDVNVNKARHSVPHSTADA